jgi:hypothetical protein
LETATIALELRLLPQSLNIFEKLKRGEQEIMYAAILSENDVLFEDIRILAKKKGFQVVGSELVSFDEVPRNVVLWLLFGYNKLGYPDMSVQGYVRIASISHRTGNSYVVLANSPGHAKAYYWLLFEGMYWWERFVSFLRRGI